MLCRTTVMTEGDAVGLAEAEETAGQCIGHIESTASQLLTSYVQVVCHPSRRRVQTTLTDYT